MQYDARKPMEFTAMATDLLMLNFFINYINYDALGKIDTSHLITSDSSMQLALDP